MKCHRWERVAEDRHDKGEDKGLGPPPASEQVERQHLVSGILVDCLGARDGFTLLPDFISTIQRQSKVKYSKQQDVSEFSKVLF